MYGIYLFRHISGSVGIICSDKKKVYEYDYLDENRKDIFYVYDLLVCGELFMDIPEEVILRIVEDEKDSK